MIMPMPAAEAAVKPLVEPGCASEEMAGVHGAAEEMAATGPRRRVCNGREAPEDVRLIGRNCGYGESIDVKCQSRVVTGKMFRWTRQAETRIHRHKGQELNTCLFSGMSQIFATREERTPVFPKSSKQAQTTEANRRETSSSETEALVPKSTVQTSLKPFSQDRSLQKLAIPSGGGSFPTESQEKQSYAVEADQKRRRARGS
jgi:hypothetical protein